MFDPCQKILDKECQPIPVLPGNPMDRGRWVAVHGVAKFGHD